MGTQIAEWIAEQVVFLNESGVISLLLGRGSCLLLVPSIIHVIITFFAKSTLLRLRHMLLFGTWS